ncbi:MAG: CaiB/BaiF CoA-transferase family protein [Pontimonas sp.]|jgi:CoA:oxalate CoA-transferase|tara:strand:+ start:1045 stop:2226 length:1182 start_codon:yes stop_codon:yes gene_type:complete
MTSISGGPLEGYLVLDFSQFLAGPMAAMRLGDLGARVIKVERPPAGDIGRGLAFGGISEDGDTLSFHITNRNKESYAADLKSDDDREKVLELVKSADVIVQNFRPGVMERLGLGYEAVRALNPTVIYASITGYGAEGPWSTRPGQDLLAQSLSGLPWLNGSGDGPPVPVGIALADIITSIHLAHGVTAALLKKERTGEGSRVDTSLLESMLDLQFELVSAHLNDPSVLVQRGAPHTAHAFLQAPYGTYPTSDGYIALAMGSVPDLGELVGLDALAEFGDPDTWWTEQTRITQLLAAHLATNTTDHWLSILDAADFWCAPVLSLPELVSHEGFAAIDMAQEFTRTRPDGTDITLTTTRAPVRFDGKPLGSPRGAPRVGEHTKSIDVEFRGKDNE